MALQDAVERVQYHAGMVSGVRAAPHNLDLTAANHGTYAWSYAAAGEMGTDSYGQGRDLHTIRTQIFLTGSDMRNLSKAGEAVIEDFVNRVRGDITLNATVDTVLTPLSYAVQFDEAQEQSRIVYTFDIRVKIRPSYTVV
jgi:hypothetical protein